MISNFLGSRYSPGNLISSAVDYKSNLYIAIFGAVTYFDSFASLLLPLYSSNQCVFQLASGKGSLYTVGIGNTTYPFLQVPYYRSIG